MKWFKDLPEGAKLLVLIVIAVVGGSMLFTSGTIIGEAISQAANQSEQS